MRTLILSTSIACGSREDTETPAPEPDPPNVNLRDTYWLDRGERLPTQTPTWCEDLSPSRLDWFEACFDPPVSCDQGLDFQAPEAELRLLLLATRCGEEELTSIRASTSYSRFSFEGRDPDDPEVDRWQVNARIWLVRPIGTGEAEVQSGDTQFHLRRDERW